MNTINVCCADAVCVIELDRPAKKNALTKAMYEVLTEAISNAAKDPAVKVLLLQGSNHVFSAGNDLEDFLENPPACDDAPVFNFVRTLMNFPKPVVAAVEGLAIGIGATLLLHCDLVYTTAATRFSFPFTGLGVVPEAGSTWLLPRLFVAVLAMALGGLVGVLIGAAPMPRSGMPCGQPKFSSMPSAPVASTSGRISRSGTPSCSANRRWRKTVRMFVSMMTSGRSKAKAAMAPAV
jgi:enoyl-CoA hydratase/carnithine racemase